MDITYKTSVNDLIKASDVTKCCSTLDDALNTSMKGYYNVLEDESTAAKGLGPSAVCIDGESIVYNKIKKYKTSINDTLNYWKETEKLLKEAAEQQRQKELKLLESAIQDEISELTTLINNMKTEQSNIKASTNSSSYYNGNFGNSKSVASGYSYYITSYGDDKKDLEKKLEEVRKLITPIHDE